MPLSFRHWFPETDIFLPTAAATLDAGRRLGLWLAQVPTGSRLVTLTGDMGAGKTTFCQGLGLGLDAEDPREIISPTFALAHEYRGRRDIFHLDLYRLESPAEFREAGLEEYLDRPGVTVVEWPDRMPPGFWPAGRLDLALAFEGEGRRLILPKDDTPMALRL